MCDSLLDLPELGCKYTVLRKCHSLPDTCGLLQGQCDCEHTAHIL